MSKLGQHLLLQAACFCLNSLPGEALAANLHCRHTAGDLSDSPSSTFPKSDNFFKVVTLPFAGGLFLPETPNSLVERGHFDKGRQVLRRIRGTQDVDVEFETIVLANEVTKTAANPWRAIFK